MRKLITAFALMICSAAACAQWAWTPWAGITAPATVTTYTAGSYTLAGTEGPFLVDATGGNVTLTLPAANYLGAGKTRLIQIKRVDVSANVVRIKPAGADTLDGSATPTGDVLLAVYAARTFATNGVTAWSIF